MWTLMSTYYTVAFGGGVGLSYGVWCHQKRCVKKYTQISWKWNAADNIKIPFFFEAVSKVMLCTLMGIRSVTSISL